MMVSPLPKCIVCDEYSVSLCPNCFKPLCMLHGVVAEKRRIKGDEFCKGKREDESNKIRILGTVSGEESKVLWSQKEEVVE